MPTGDLAYTPFNHQHPFAPDLRMQRDTINARDVISAPIRWEGMLVYVLENETTYQLKGGLTNEFWVVFGGSGDVSNAVLYTIQSLTPEQQLQARTNIGAAELLDGLISLGEVTSTGNDVTIASVLARINGVEVGQNDPTTIAVPVPTEGYTRRDLIVIDSDALIYLVQGTEVVDGEPALTPNVPEDTVVLTEVFSNDAGLQDFYDFAFAHFVRFDINDQGLSPAQRLNARTNIQALSKDTNDSRTGALTQTGLLTVIGDYIQTVSNSTASARAWGFENPDGGGASFQRRGGLTVVAKGDSATDYFIIRGFDSTETEVFRVRAGGVTKGGDAVNEDDFVTLGQVVGLIASADTTDMSATDFYTGHQDDLDPDAGVIYAKGSKDIIYEDSGSQFLYPTFMGNLVLANKDIVVNGVGYADIGNEFSITNSTGVIRTLPDNFVGAPAQTSFDFGGTDLDIAPDETVYFKANDAGTAWEVSAINTVAFSDALNSVNATFSTGPDNLGHISGVYDKNTGEEVTFKEFTGATPTTDGVVFIQIGVKYFKRVFSGPVKVQWWGAKADDETFDSYDYIQESISSIYPNVDISAGTFYSSGIINIPSNKHISGNGKLKKFTFQQSSPLINFPTDTQNVVVDGLELDSNAYFPDNAVGNANSTLRIYGANIKNIYLKNLIIRNAGRDGVYVNDNTGVKEPMNIKVDNCRFFDITRNCVSVINGDGVHLTNNYYNRWNLVAIDFEPNSSTKHLPNRNHTVLNSKFIEYDFPATSGRATVQASTGSSGADANDIQQYGNIRVDGNTLEVVTVKTVNFFRSSEFQQCVITNNVIPKTTLNAIILSSAPNSIISNNKILDFDVADYDSENLLSGLITLSFSDYVTVIDNEINGSNYNGFYLNRSNYCEISGNKSRNIGQATGHNGSRSHIHLQNVNFSNIHSNILDETEVSSFATRGIYCYANTTFENYENIIKNNTISIKIPENVVVANFDRQISVQNNDFTSDPFKTGRIVDNLPTATEYNRGRIYRINSTGSDSDKYYVCVLNSDDSYSWIEIFLTQAIPDASVTEKGIVRLATSAEGITGTATDIAMTPYAVDFKRAGTSAFGGIRLTGDLTGTSASPEVVTAETHRSGKIEIATQTEVDAGTDSIRAITPLTLHNKVYKPSINKTSTNNLLVSTDILNYIRFTGSSGIVTIPPDTYNANDEIVGEVEGGEKTFEGGAGVTLRTPTGQGLNSPTGSRFLIKFKTANDPLVTIIKPYAVAPLSATPTLDFPEIDAGATETLTATVTGAVVGDNVNVTGPTDLYASTCFIQSSWVSAADTVSVRVKNDGGSAVDLASGAYSIKVFPQ